MVFNDELTQFYGPGQPPLLRIWAKWLLPMTIKVLVGTIGFSKCSVKKGVLKNFAKLTGKHLCRSVFFNKVLGPATVLW